MIRFHCVTFRTSALPLLLVLTLLACGTAVAQVEEEVQPEPSASDPQIDSEERKSQEREARIEEYLRKKEERRIEREQAELGRAAEEARSLESQQIAGAAAAGAAGAIDPTRPNPNLPKDLARAQMSVRATSLAQEPTVSGLLDVIDRREASAQQLAAFGNFLGEHGMIREAIEYYNVAVRLEDRDAVLWLNLGTLHRKVNQLSPAVSAYSRALGVNSNYSLAHYNLGAVFDMQGRYKQAIESYKTALRLDPQLGDPLYNPQAANNDRLLAVKLILYKESGGNEGLPLISVGEGVDTVAAP